VVDKLDLLLLELEPRLLALLLDMLAEQEGMLLVFKMEGMVGRMLRVLKPLPLDLHLSLLLVGTRLLGSLANIVTPPIGA
jgi:hypothetical protein